MFLIAALHIQASEDCDTIKSMKAAVNALPENLDRLYEQTLERIRRLKPEGSKIGLMALLWATYAKQPLDIHELQELLATEYTIGSLELAHFNSDTLPEKNVILASACGLLTVDASGKVRLIRK